MDKQALGVLIPLLAVLFVGLHSLSRTLIGKAIARRIEGGTGLPEAAHRHLLELQQEVDALRIEIAETQERLDFAERLIARQSQGDRAGNPA